jgi:hypothetical protein
LAAATAEASLGSGRAATSALASTATSTVAPASSLASPSDRASAMSASLPPNVLVESRSIFSGIDRSGLRASSTIAGTAVTGASTHRVVGSPVDASSARGSLATFAGGARRRRTSSVAESTILPRNASEATPAIMPAIVKTTREVGIRDVSIARLLLFE